MRLSVDIAASLPCTWHCVGGCGRQKNPQPLSVFARSFWHSSGWQGGFSQVPGPASPSRPNGIVGTNTGHRGSSPCEVQSSGEIFQTRGRIFVMSTGGKVDALKCFYSLFSWKLFLRNDSQTENFSQQGLTSLVALHPCSQIGGGFVSFPPPTPGAFDSAVARGGCRERFTGLSLPPLCTHNKASSVSGAEVEKPLSTCTRRTARGPGVLTTWGCR